MRSYIHSLSLGLLFLGASLTPATTTTTKQGFLKRIVGPGLPLLAIAAAFRSSVPIHDQSSSSGSPPFDDDARRPGMCRLESRTKFPKSAMAARLLASSRISRWRSFLSVRGTGKADPGGPPRTPISSVAINVRDAHPGSVHNREIFFSSRLYLFSLCPTGIRLVLYLDRTPVRTDPCIFPFSSPGGFRLR